MSNDLIDNMNKSKIALKEYQSEVDDSVEELITEYEYCYALLSEMNEYLNTNKMTNIMNGSIFHQMIQVRLK